MAPVAISLYILKMDKAGEMRATIARDFSRMLISNKFRALSDQLLRNFKNSISTKKPSCDDRFLFRLGSKK